MLNHRFVPEGLHGPLCKDLRDAPFCTIGTNDGLVVFIRNGVQDELGFSLRPGMSAAGSHRVLFTWGSRKVVQWGLAGIIAGTLEAGNDVYFLGVLGWSCMWMISNRNERDTCVCWKGEGGVIRSLGEDARKAVVVGRTHGRARILSRILR